jgi:hypothetical protein
MQNAFAVLNSSRSCSSGPQSRKNLNLGYVYGQLSLKLPQGSMGCSGVEPPRGACGVLVSYVAILKRPKMPDRLQVMRI